MLNLRAIGLMVLSMLCFSIEDMFIKIVSNDASVAQILLILGAVGGVFYMGFAYIRGETLTREIIADRLLWTRTLSEVVGSFGFVMALALIPLSNASAILQATPLVVTMAAALLLRESVGWRRWTAVFIGFVGVLLIIRPGSDGFDENSIFAVIGVLGLAGRDVITRRIPTHVPTSWISAQAFLGASLLGLVMLAGPQRWEPLTAYSLGILMIASIVGIVGYFAITTATRIGETSAIAPFRYARLIFALIIGYIVFGERPDGWVLLGSAILISTGIFAIYREQIVMQARPAQ
jgi:drug/metabolite transporter (DMT)-like permease